MITEIMQKIIHFLKFDESLNAFIRQKIAESDDANIRNRINKKRIFLKNMFIGLQYFSVK